MTIGKRIVAAAACGSCVLAWAASPARADLPQNVREDQSAAGNRSAISGYVAGLVTHIKPGDPKESQYREELCRQIETGIVQPSASFQSVYVDCVMPAIKPMLTDKDVMIRLNAAIIVARLSIAAPQLGSQLQPTIVTLLNDERPAVALWGLKAAGAVLPQMLAVPLLAQQQKLTPAITAAFTKFHAVDAVVQEAYTSLDLPMTPPPPPKSAIELCAVTMTGLLNIRLKDYATTPPQNPQADKAAVLFISLPSTVQNLTPAARLQVAQVASNLFFAAVNLAGKQQAGQTRDDLYAVAVSAAGAMYNIMQVAANPDAVAAYTQLLKLPATMTNDAIVQKGLDALKAARTSADYKTLKDPAPPATAPTTAK